MKGNRIFDNGGKTYDRYTLIAADGSVFGFNENPYHPQGFGQYGGEWEGGSTRHLGKKITAASLPAQAKKYVKAMTYIPSKKKAKVAKLPSCGKSGAWGKHKIKRKAVTKIGKIR